MAKDVANARAYGDGAVWVAPVGTTAPTTPTAVYGTGWKEIGWISDDGITEARDQSTTDVNAWQGGARVRTIKSSDSRTFQFQALEENVTVMGLMRPGSTPSTTTGITTTNVKVATAADRRAFGIDLVDGTVHKRILIPTGEVTGTGDIVYTNDDLTVYEMTVTCYPDSAGTLYTEITDAAGVLIA